MDSFASKLDKRFEGFSPAKLLGCSTEALKGVSTADAEALQKALGIRTIQDLATNKFFLTAQAILQAATAPVAAPPAAPVAAPPAAPARTLASVFAGRGVSGLGIAISPDAVAAGGAPLLDAVDAALGCFIHCGDFTESPIWMMHETPHEFGLSAPVSAEAASAKVVSLLGTSGCSLALLTDAEDPADEWAGKVQLDETGELFGTNDFWIFSLKNSPFTDLNRAVVSRKDGSCKCWGFS